ncbi:VOC family protein [Sphingomonas jatrophae]|uniref:VOC domain-containing protein n=1 Tax=Sphingomonas jatrophae TaxID=1166337 RepID=A0A1I6LHX9_9SPHN|nr:VOC family protein [Sphingomonas jatrophae]SFS03087.1 hypothetical protein SAMN05192580_2762 [Sphingomonas jatrophae]
MSENEPIWYELMTSDADAAQAFYAAVTGWTIAPSGMPGIDYRILMAPDGEAIGGLMTAPPGFGDGPTWFAYYGVTDTDAKAAEIEAAGGRILMPPMSLGGVGRMALLADPWGATFYVMTPETEGDRRAFEAAQDARPGHAVWNELASPDPDAALAFYAGRFGWRQEGAMPMGELGDYRFLHAGALSIGALMREIRGAKAGWTTYFMVPDIDAAARAVTAGGGEVLQGPDEIPGGSFALVARDPQGATVGFVGARA